MTLASFPTPSPIRSTPSPSHATAAAPTAPPALRPRRAADDAVADPTAMSEAAFAVALAAAEPSLGRFALHLAGERADADDLYQDVALRLFRYRRQFRPGSNFGAWSRQVMRNQFLGQWRTAVRRCRIAESEARVERWVNEHVERRLPDAELRAEDLRRLIRALSPVLRTTFELHAAGYSSVEIGERLGAPVGTVKSRIHHARRKLMAAMAAMAAMAK